MDHDAIVINGHSALPYVCHVRGWRQPRGPGHQFAGKNHALQAIRRFRYIRNQERSVELDNGLESNNLVEDRNPLRTVGGLKRNSNGSRCRLSVDDKSASHISAWTNDNNDTRG